MTKALDGRVALVSGAAKGIGRASAERLAAAGATVIVADLREDEGAAVVAAITGSGGNAEFHNLDVTREDSWIAITAHVDATYGKLDIIMNNAGIAISAPDTSQMALADFERQLAVNVTGVFLGCKHAIPLMRKAGKGSIINVSSTAGMRGSRGMAGYSASKGAVRLMSKSLAQELGPQGIRVNSIHPGLVGTDLWQQIDAPSVPGGDLDLLNEMAKKSVPLGRRGEPADIADVVVWLASDDSRYVSGTEIVIDGAMTA